MGLRLNAKHERFLQAVTLHIFHICRCAVFAKLASRPTILKEMVPRVDYTLNNLRASQAIDGENAF